MYTEKHRVYQRGWYRRNKVRLGLAQRQREYRKNNPGKHYTANRKWRHGHSDQRMVQKARYYSKHGKNVRGGGRWTIDEKELCLQHKIPDVELGILINRSVQAIQVMRVRLSKAKKYAMKES